MGSGRPPAQQEPHLAHPSPGVEGARKLIEEVSDRNISALVCLTHEEPGYVREALAASACGYITMREAPRELAHAVRGVLEGWLLVSPRAAERLS